MENISKHITYKEAIKSNTATKLGIDNTPTEDQLKNMIELAENVFEPLREGLGNRPINISIFFRCPLLNKAIKGAKNSQHVALKGAAIDLDNDNMPKEWPTNREIFDYIKDNLTFEQLIYEAGDDDSPGWVHVSYNSKSNRKQVLRFINGGYITYV
jgi:zinc D-Ala-D-Ala carboxypeptidase